MTPGAASAEGLLAEREARYQRAVSNGVSPTGLAVMRLLDNLQTQVERWQDEVEAVREQNRKLGESAQGYRADLADLTAASERWEAGTKVRLARISELEAALEHCRAFSSALDFELNAEQRLEDIHATAMRVLGKP